MGVSFTLFLTSSNFHRSDLHNNKKNYFALAIYDEESTRIESNIRPPLDSVMVTRSARLLIPQPNTYRSSSLCSTIQRAAVHKIWRRGPVSSEVCVFTLFVLRSSPYHTPIKPNIGVRSKKSSRTTPAYRTLSATHVKMVMTTHKPSIWSLPESESDCWVCRNRSLGRGERRNLCWWRERAGAYAPISSAIPATPDGAVFEPAKICVLPQHTPHAGGHPSSSGSKGAPSRHSLDVVS